ncbi:hypothetical protein MRB53_001280 [Persea americana]|uniref:Uncharacterized protein n=1 Tax=Persea americana TaxID=3435 RepID=A0ACC2MTM1_PERAE|nr:hypothetical protein MRB53_001280 [Persea americana]
MTPSTSSSVPTRLSFQFHTDISSYANCPQHANNRKDFDFRLAEKISYYTRHPVFTSLPFSFSCTREFAGKLLEGKKLPLFNRNSPHEDQSEEG